MAAETINMIKLKQIFLLHQNGESYRQIARITGTSKNTVKKYIRTALLKGNQINELSVKEDHELEKLFAEPVIESRDRNLDLLSFFPYMVEIISERINAKAERNVIYWKTPVPGTSSVLSKYSNK